MKVLTITSADLEDYPRGKIIYDGLKQNKVNVEAYSSKGILKYFNIFKRLLKKDYNVLIINGLIVFAIARVLTFKPIILDAFISHYDNLVNDRKKVKKGSIKAKFLRFSDRWSCKLATKVILDTNAHINYFVNEFKLNKRKFYKIPIGADDSIFYLKEKKIKGEFRVIFFGTFIPLQGIEFILKAIKLLEGEEIVFYIVGRGQEYNKMVNLAKKLKLKETIFYNMEKPETLVEMIKSSDICLGIFGDTEKTQKVIPNKVYEAIAMKKAVITANTPAIREEFTHKKDIYLCDVADSKALANSILHLKNDKELRNKLAKEGYKLFKERFSNKVIGEQVKDLLIDKTDWGELE